MASTTAANTLRVTTACVNRAEHRDRPGMAGGQFGDLGLVGERRYPPDGDIERAASARFSLRNVGTIRPGRPGARR